MLPRYSGLRTSANGPVATSGPSRSLRVREIAPMWCTAHSRSSSPATVDGDARRQTRIGGR